jgi:hypothetical protein
MRHRSAEISRRRMVLQLAAMREADRDAIMGLLEPGHRQAIQSCLSENGDASIRASTGSASSFSTMPLSPWMIELLGNGNMMSQRGWNALREEALERFATTSAIIPDASRKGPSLIARIFGRVTGAPRL